MTQLLASRPDTVDGSDVNHPNAVYCLLCRASPVDVTAAPIDTPDGTRNQQPDRATSNDSAAQSSFEIPRYQLQMPEFSIPRSWYELQRPGDLLMPQPTSEQAPSEPTATDRARQELPLVEPQPSSDNRQQMEHASGTSFFKVSTGIELNPDTSKTLPAFGFGHELELDNPLLHSIRFEADLSRDEHKLGARLEARHPLQSSHGGHAGVSLGGSAGLGMQGSQSSIQLRLDAFLQEDLWKTQSAKVTHRPYVRVVAEGTPEYRAIDDARGIFQVGTSIVGKHKIPFASGSSVYVTVHPSIWVTRNIGLFGDQPLIGALSPTSENTSVQLKGEGEIGVNVETGKSYVKGVVQHDTNKGPKVLVLVGLEFRYNWP